MPINYIVPRNPDKPTAEGPKVFETDPRDAIIASSLDARVVKPLSAADRQRLLDEITSSTRPKVISGPYGPYVVHEPVQSDTYNSQ